MIEARGVTKRFGSHAVLDGIDLQVKAGERVALLGLNGAGKTTLMRCLLGLIRYDGDLRIGERDVRAEPREARALLGYVPQRAPHFDGTLAEVVEFFGRLRGIERHVVLERLDSLGLSIAEHGSKTVATLSGGMLQKLLLALALGDDTPLLLLDEPTANLDPRARHEFLRALRRVDRRTTVLLASHRLADVQAVAERMLVLHHGGLVFDGTMHELWERVGATVTLWLRVPPNVRDEARDRLRTRYQLPSTAANGAAFGVCVVRGGGADVLVDLRKAGIPVEEFWTESPSLQDLLEGVLSPHGGVDAHS